MVPHVAQRGKAVTAVWFSRPLPTLLVTPESFSRAAIAVTTGGTTGGATTSPACMSLPENRKVGGSTPPLATTITAGQEPLTCGFVFFSGPRRFRSPTTSDREYPRLATSYRASYRTELRSETSGANAQGSPGACLQMWATRS